MTKVEKKNNTEERIALEKARARGQVNSAQYAEQAEKLGVPGYEKKDKAE